MSATSVADFICKEATQDGRWRLHVFWSEEDFKEWRQENPQPDMRPLGARVYGRRIHPDRDHRYEFGGGWD